MNEDDLELDEREQILADRAAAKVLATQEVAGERQRIVLRRVVIAVAIALLISLGGTTLGWYLSQQQAERINEEAVHRAEAIQSSRLQVLTENCQETNRRYRGTNDKLDELAAKIKHPTARQTRGTQSAKLLIAALVPYTGDPTKNIVAGDAACVRYAKQQLRTTG